MVCEAHQGEQPSPRSHTISVSVSGRGEGAEGRNVDARGRKSCRPRKLRPRGFWFRDESRFGVSNAGFPAPSGVLGYLRQSCQLTKQSARSLRRRKSKAGVDV